MARSIKGQLTYILNSLTLSNSFQNSVLNTITLPALLIAIAHHGYTSLLGWLAGASSLFSMLIPPLVGHLSDRSRFRIGKRRPYILLGTLINVIGLLGIYHAKSIPSLAVAFLLSVAGQVTQGIAHQALWSDVVPVPKRGQIAGYRGIATLIGTISGLLIASFSSGYAVLIPMIILQVIATIAITGGIPDSLHDLKMEVPKEKHHQPINFNFIKVFIAQGFVTFGMTLLMTFILFFFHDVLHVSNPSSGTASVAILALLGSASSTVIMGRVSDKGKRNLFVSLASIPMAMAAIGFALWQQQQGIFLFAILFGVGYGTYLSTDWALMLDQLQNQEDMGRNIGIWGVASIFPAVIAPPFGSWLIASFHQPHVAYRVLFITAGVCFGIAGTIIFWIKNSDQPSMPMTAEEQMVQRPSTISVSLLRHFIAWIMKTYLLLHYRLVIEGSPPPQKGAILVIANHQHDLDGMIIPPLLTSMRPYRHAAFCVASKRLFEPGFLAFRGPKWMRPLLYRVNLAHLFRSVGILPMENQPLKRPISSYSHEIYEHYGNLLLSEVFQPELMMSIQARPEERLKDLWGIHLSVASRQEVTMQTLLPNYKQFIKKNERTKIEEELQCAKFTLQAGEMLFLTPEGKYTQHGKLIQMKQALKELLPFAERIIVSTITYDPFIEKKMLVYVRFDHTSVEEAITKLAITRPVTLSHLVAYSWAHRKIDTMTMDELIESVRSLLQHMIGIKLSGSVQPIRTIVPIIVKRMTEYGLLKEINGNYHQGIYMNISEFPGVEDILSYYSNMLEETIQSLTFMDFANSTE